jgi:amidohydrolase
MHPEVSGEEVETARMIAAALGQMSPTRILTGLGGHGVAAIFDSGAEGPTVLFRAELDTLPIQELSDVPWVSEVAGKGHLCGHDGHMVILLALGRVISRNPVEKGKVILMFQPAEEDGSGARAVVADPAFAGIAPDWAFAIHIDPGRPFGFVATCAGVINCASQGLAIRLTGKTAHAADPENGVSPAQAVSRLIPALIGLGTGGDLDETFRLLTITHVKMGEPTFGIAPGEAVIFATLRTTHDNAMQQLVADTRALAKNAAKELVH